MRERDGEQPDEVASAEHDRLPRLTSAALTAQAGADLGWAVEVRRAAGYVPDHRRGELGAVRDHFAQTLGSRRYRYVDDWKLFLFAASPAEAERFRASALELIEAHGFFLVVRLLERGADSRWVRRLDGSADTAAIEEELLRASESIRPLRHDERALLNHLLAFDDPRLESLQEQLGDVYVVDDTDWPEAIALVVDGATWATRGARAGDLCRFEERRQRRGTRVALAPRWLVEPDPARVVRGTARWTTGSR